MSSLDDLSSTSQHYSLDGFIKENTSTTDTARAEIILWKRDEVDLVILNDVGEANGVEICELEKNLPISYSALASRMRKLIDLELLKRSQRIGARTTPRPPYIFSLGTALTLETVKGVINRRGIDVRQFRVKQENKRAATTDTFDSGASTSELQQTDVCQEPTQSDSETQQLDNLDSLESNFETSTNSNIYSTLEPINTAKPLDVTETSETKIVVTESNCITSTNSNSNADVWQVLARIAQEIVALKQENVNLKEEVANLRNCLANFGQDPQKVSEGKVNEIWNILEQIQNGKATN